MGFLSTLTITGAALLVVVTAQGTNTSPDRGGFRPPPVIHGGFKPVSTAALINPQGPPVSIGRNNVGRPVGRPVNIGRNTVRSPVNIGPVNTGRNTIGTPVNGGRNSITDGAGKSDPLSVVPSVSAELRKLSRRNEPVSLVSLWKYVLENDGQGAGPAQRINFEPKTILVPENYVTGRHVPADAGNPLYGESPEATKLRRDFVMDHLVLDLVEPTDPKLSQGAGVKALTLSKKEVFIRTDSTGTTFVDFIIDGTTKKSVAVTATASLNDGTQVYWLEDFLFDNGIKVAATFEIEQGFGRDTLFGPLGAPLDLSEFTGGASPPAPPSFNGAFPQQPFGPPPPPQFGSRVPIAPPPPPPRGVVGPPSIRIDDSINVVEEPARPFDLGRAQPAAPFGAGGGLGRRPVPFGIPISFEDQPVNIETDAGRTLFDPVALDEIGVRPTPLFLANRPGRQDEIGVRPTPLFLANRPGRQVEDSQRTGRVQPAAPSGAGGDELGVRLTPNFLAGGQRTGRAQPKELLGAGGNELGVRPTPSFLAADETSARRARQAFKSSPREGAPGQMTPSFFGNPVQVRN